MPRSTKGRTFHCSQCSHTARTLGMLRSHHSKKHRERFYSNLAAGQKGKGKATHTPKLKVVTTIPTAPRPAPVTSRPHITRGALTFCPCCGERVGSWRRTGS